ncbi:MAG: GNAT family N-acetyltransferase [Streptosporangiaceae bacterium]
MVLARRLGNIENLSQLLVNAGPAELSGPVRYTEAIRPRAAAPGAVHAVTGNHVVVGCLIWRSGTVSSVVVSPSYQRQGIGAELYRRGNQAAGQKLEHSTVQSDAGARWASSVGRH